MEARKFREENSDTLKYVHIKEELLVVLKYIKVVKVP